MLCARPKGGVRPVREGEREWQGGASRVAVPEEEAGRRLVGPDQVELYQVHCGQGRKSGGATWTEYQSSAAEEEPREVLLEGGS